MSMEQVKVSQDALLHMANVLRLCAEEILTLKQQMDNELHSMLWDDPTGLSFVNRYEEGFKTLRMELIPQIEEFVKNIALLDIQTSEYAGTAAMVGIGIGVASMAERNSFEGQTSNNSNGAGKMPQLRGEERCQFPHTANEYYNKWAYTTDKNGGQVLRRYPLGPDGKELTAYNYREFDKKTLMKSLSYGMGFDYEERDMGELHVKGKEVFGHKGRWENGKMLINRQLLNDQNISHEALLETVFHENQHRIQNEQLTQGCLTGVPKDGGHLSDKCVSELQQGIKVTETCETEYENYRNHWTERQAREEGAVGRKLSTRNYMTNKQLFKDL